MFPVQVYHRACTIGAVSVAGMVWRAGQVGFGTVSVQNILMGMASRVSMAGMVDAADIGTQGTVRMVIVCVCVWRGEGGDYEYTGHRGGYGGRGGNSGTGRWWAQ